MIKELEKEQALIEDVIKNGMKEYNIKSLIMNILRLYTIKRWQKVDYEEY